MTDRIYTPPAEQPKSLWDQLTGWVDWVFPGPAADQYRGSSGSEEASTNHCTMAAAEQAQFTDDAVEQAREAMGYGPCDYPSKSPAGPDDNTTASTRHTRR